MKAYLGSGRKVSVIIDFGNRRMWVVSFTFQPLYLWGPRKSSCWNLVGPKARSWRGEKLSEYCQKQTSALHSRASNFTEWDIQAPNLLKQVFAERTICFNIKKFSILLMYCLMGFICFVFYKINSYFSEQHKPADICIREPLCFLWGTNRIIMLYLD